MPYKDDDIDSLFQDAAENYPLKINTPGWESVESKLTASSAATKTKPAEKYNVLKYALMLVLLAGFSALVYKYKSDILQKTQPKQTVNRNAARRPQPANQSQQYKTAEQNIVATQPNNALQPAKSVKARNNIVAVNKPHIFTEFKVEVVENKTKNKIAVNSHQPFINQKTSSGEVQYDASLNSGNSIRPSEKIAAVDNEVLQQKTELRKQIIPIVTPKNNTPVNNNVSKPMVNTIRLKPAYTIYGVLYGGAELSTVKFQRIDKPGYRIGVALGYKISKKLHAEIGLQRERVNFYSNARYIDTSNLKIRPNTLVNNVSVGSKVTSVPVTLRYNLSSKPNHFYIAARVNAVVITHTEHYQYSVVKNGEEKDLSKKYSAQKSPKYFTGISASAGYQAKLSNWCNFKIEPYYQTPINNFGAGKLPVSSFGIDIGIVKDLK